MAESGAYDDWEVVAEVGQPYQADLIKLRLRDAGLEAEIVDQGSEQIPIPASADFGLYRVVVPKEKADEARRALAQSVELPEDAEVPVGSGEEPES